MPETRIAPRTVTKKISVGDVRSACFTSGKMLMTKGFAPNRGAKLARPTTVKADEFSQRLKDCFASIQDPRVERTRLHQLSDILTIAILSVIALR